VDTPHHLEALLSGDEAAVAEALEHLYVAVLHQGNTYSATPPVIRIVAGYLDEMAVAPAVREDLLYFLASAAQSTFEIEHSEYYRRLLPDLQAALAATYHSVSAYADASGPDLRTAATEAAVSYARCSPLREHRPALGALVRQRITDGDKRAWHVAKLIELSESVTGYLDDSEFEVRITAALAPEMAHRADATEILIAGLEEAAGIGSSANFPVESASDPLLEYANSLIDPDPWRGYTLAELIAVTIRRVNDFALIAEPAAQLVRTASWTGANTTWGPLVIAAFHPGYRKGATLTGSQRLIVSALLDNPGLWRPKDGNAGLVFKQAGLPRDRNQCTQLLNSTS
jgi:hypothetical protein